MQYMLVGLYAFSWIPEHISTSWVLPKATSWLWFSSSVEAILNILDYEVCTGSLVVSKGSISLLQLAWFDSLHRTFFGFVVLPSSSRLCHFVGYLGAFPGSASYSSISISTNHSTSSSISISTNYSTSSSINILTNYVLAIAKTKSVDRLTPYACTVGPLGKTRILTLGITKTLVTTAGTHSSFCCT